MSLRLISHLMHHASVDKIREVIGPAGKMVNKIIEETGVTIDINDDGNVFVTSPNVEGIDKAIKMIEDIVREIKVGEVFEGTVTRIATFGAFLELLPGREGMCHISQLATKRVENALKRLKMSLRLAISYKSKSWKLTTVARLMSVIAQCLIQIRLNALVLVPAVVEIVGGAVIQKIPEVVVNLQKVRIHLLILKVLALALIQEIQEATEGVEDN